MVEGEVVLVTDDGEEMLRAGDSAGFKAGDPNGHCFQNRSAADVVLLEIGTRIAEDAAHYSDIDMVTVRRAPGLRPPRRHAVSARASGQADRCSVGDGAS